MSTPTSQPIVTTPVIGMSRRIVLSSPSESSTKDSDSEAPWDSFQDLVGVQGSPSPEANLAVVDSCVQEVGSEVEGGPSGA